MKTLLEQSMECCVNIYHEYCILKPMDDYLQLNEFKKLVKEQAKPFLNNTTPAGMDQDAYITRIFRKADRNGDGKVSFAEFISCLSLFLIDTHIRAHDIDGSGHGHSHGDGHGHGHSH